MNRPMNNLTRVGIWLALSLSVWGVLIGLCVLAFNMGRGS